MAWTDLHLAEDDDVCTILHLREWGEKTPSYDVNQHSGSAVSHASSLGKLKEHLRTVVRLWDKEYDEYYYQHTQPMASKEVHRMACIQSVTCSLQPKAEEYLEQLGFTRIGPFEKLKHPDTSISVWIIGAPQFLEAIKE